MLCLCMFVCEHDIWKTQRARAPKFVTLTLKPSSISTCGPSTSTGKGTALLFDENDSINEMKM